MFVQTIEDNNNNNTKNLEAAERKYTFDVNNMYITDAKKNVQLRTYREHTINPLEYIQCEYSINFNGHNFLRA